LTCERCKEIQKIANDIRDCSLCPKPDGLLPENINAYEIYLLVRTQFIVAGMGDVIGLNYSAVLETIKLYIDDDSERRDVFEKVVYLSQFDLKKIHEEQKKSTKK